jgi:hypothetical protein
MEYLYITELFVPVIGILIFCFVIVFAIMEHTRAYISLLFCSVLWTFPFFIEHNCWRLSAMFVIIILLFMFLHFAHYGSEGDSSEWWFRLGVQSPQGASSCSSILTSSTSYNPNGIQTQDVFIKCPQSNARWGGNNNLGIIGYHRNENTQLADLTKPCLQDPCEWVPTERKQDYLNPGIGIDTTSILLSSKNTKLCPRVLSNGLGKHICSACHEYFQKQGWIDSSTTDCATFIKQDEFCSFCPRMNSISELRQFSYMLFTLLVITCTYLIGDLFSDVGKFIFKKQVKDNE